MNLLFVRNSLRFLQRHSAQLGFCVAAFLILKSTCVCSEVFKHVSVMLLKAVIEKGLSEDSLYMH